MSRSQRTKDFRNLISLKTKFKLFQNNIDYQNDNEFKKDLNSYLSAKVKYYNINFELIKNDPNKDWNWFAFSFRDDLQWDLVEKNPDKDWNWFAFSLRNDLQWDLVEQYPDKDWDWSELSLKNDLPWSLLEKFPDKDWDWEYINSIRTDVPEFINNMYNKLFN